MKKLLFIIILAIISGCSFPESCYPRTEKQSEELYNTFKNMRRKQRIDEMEMRIEKLEQGFRDF